MVALAFASKSVIELLIVREAVHTLAKPPGNPGQKRRDILLRWQRKSLLFWEPDYSLSIVVQELSLSQE